jgi:hypothetical protein
MKRDDLIKLLKTIPENVNVVIRNNGDEIYFDKIETVKIISFPTHDEDGNEMKNQKIEKEDPVTTLHFCN